MRCWVGKEVEHNYSYGGQSLFVESSDVDVYFVNKMLKQYQEVDTVYLGAGEVDAFRVFGKQSEIDKLKASSVKVVLECSTNNFNNVSNQLLDLCDQIIIRTPVLDLSQVTNKDVFLKYRTTSEVGMKELCKFKVTDIKDVKDGRYPHDTLIYED